MTFKQTTHWSSTGLTGAKLHQEFPTGLPRVKAPFLQIIDSDVGANLLSLPLANDRGKVFKT